MGRGAGRDEVEEDLKFFGATSAAEAYAGKQNNDLETFYVEPDNWKSVQAFIAVQTQFRRSGFRYEGLKAGLDMAGFYISTKLFTEIRLMEAGALKVMAEQDDE